MTCALAAVGGALVLALAYGIPLALALADELGPYWWRQRRARRRARKRTQRWRGI